MTLKELAHAAQQHLQTRAGCSVKRSHVYELLAAAFGYQSWAALLGEALLADAGVGDAPRDASPRVIGRAVQLGYGQSTSVDMASALLRLAAERKLSSLRWSQITALLERSPGSTNDADQDDDEGEDWDADDDAAGVGGQDATQSRLLTSPLLLDGLERWAEDGGAERHHVLAALYRCARPNPYLYEESLKGRLLTAVERGWVDDYLQLAPRFAKYEHHLKAAALGGHRASALEYADVFESPEFFKLAERLSGDVDAQRMATLAATPEARAKWLEVAADQGSEAALQQLAREGDRSALERLAERGDIDALRDAAEQAVQRGEPLRAWTWQYLALLHGVDLTRSTMAAYHDGGPQDWQFYDSDFGGNLYVSGNEPIELPELNHAEHRKANAMAQEIFKTARVGTGPPRLIGKGVAGEPR
jgi:hypothetical protein